jgi:uncharacterized protein with PQ loop repeat
MNSNALHEHHKRLRRSAAAAEAPWVKKLDKLMYVVGALGLIMTIPQIAEIWVNHNAGGVSVISWISYTIFSVIWLIYGIVHKERVIIFTQFFWVILNAVIAVGAILY